MPGRRTLRIALVHHSVPPVVGGVERVLAQHARLLVADRHAVRLVVARGEAPDPRVELARVPLVDSLEPVVAAVQSELDAGTRSRAFTDLRDHLRAELAPLLADRDVVICHNVASLNKNLALTGALHALATGPAAPRFVLWHHDLAWTLPHYRATLHDGDPWDLLRTAWPGAVQVAISATRARDLEELMGLAPGSARVIPNGVDPAVTLGLDAGTPAQVDLPGLLRADPLLLMPSRILPRKRIGSGVRVVAALHALGRPAGLVVAGPADPHEREPGGYLARLRAIADELGVAGSVWMPGAEREGGVPDRLLADLYALADALFLPSRDEGFGIPVLEAALHRLPIACTDLPVLREVAGDAALYLDPAEPPEATAARLVAWLDRDPAARLARRVRHETTWDAVYERSIRPLLAEVAA